MQRQETTEGHIDTASLRGVELKREEETMDRVQKRVTTQFVGLKRAVCNHHTKASSALSWDENDITFALSQKIKNKKKCLQHKHILTLPHLL